MPNMNLRTLALVALLVEALARRTFASRLPSMIFDLSAYQWVAHFQEDNLRRLEPVKIADHKAPFQNFAPERSLLRKIETGIDFGCGCKRTSTRVRDGPSAFHLFFESAGFSC
jgi:hypothetical protein